MDNKMILFVLDNRIFNSIRYKIKSRAVWLNRYMNPKKAFFSPISLYVETTNQCNGKCFYCFRNVSKSYEEKDLSIDTFKYILSQIPSNAVIFEGCAEPLMNHDLPDLIEYANKQGRFTYFTTNGKLLNLEKSKKIISAGLSVLRFSVNSLDADKSLLLKTGISFPIVEDNIINFVKIMRDLGYKYPILESVTVVMKDNFEEIPDIVKRMTELGVKKIYFNDFVSYSKELEQKRIDRNQFQILKKIEEQLNNDGILTELCFFRRFEPLKTCILPWQWLNVKMNGNVYPCFQGTIEDLLVGNIFNNSFKEIWHGRLISRLRKDIVKGLKQNCDICNNHGWILPNQKGH